MLTDTGRMERSNISAKVKRPNELENTFGPEVKFTKASGLDKQNLPRSAGMQFFGRARIDGVSGQ